MSALIHSPHCEPLAYFRKSSAHIVNAHTFYLIDIAIPGCFACIISTLSRVFRTVCELIALICGKSAINPITEDSNSQSSVLDPVRLYHHNPNIQFLEIELDF